MCEYEESVKYAERYRLRGPLIESRIAEAMFCRAGSPAASRVARANSSRALACSPSRSRTTPSANLARAYAGASESAAAKFAFGRVVATQAFFGQREIVMGDRVRGIGVKKFAEIFPCGRGVATAAVRRSRASRAPAPTPARALRNDRQFFVLLASRHARCQPRRGLPSPQENRDRARSRCATHAPHRRYAADSRMQSRDRNRQSSPVVPPGQARRCVRIRRPPPSTRLGLRH